MTEKQKRGRGRPKGSTSTVDMTLEDLLKELDGDMKATVPVGRVWLANRTPAGLKPEPESEPTKQVEAEPKIEFTIS
tara:strand:+ start:405 stop:635 length:231 start_codon:yes stop_codon:yes gene_type:complete